VHPVERSGALLDVVANANQCHAVNGFPQTKLERGLQLMHSANDVATDWLKTWLVNALNNNNNNNSSSSSNCFKSPSVMLNWINAVLVSFRIYRCSEMCRKSPSSGTRLDPTSGLCPDPIAWESIQISLQSSTMSSHRMETTRSLLTTRPGLTSLGAYIALQFWVLLKSTKRLFSNWFDTSAACRWHNKRTYLLKKLASL